MSLPPLEIGQMIELARLSINAAGAHVTALEAVMPGKGPATAMHLLADAKRELAKWIEETGREAAKEFADGLPGYGP